jgi:hypothetical protein
LENATSVGLLNSQLASPLELGQHWLGSLKQEDVEDQFIRAQLHANNKNSEAAELPMPLPLNARFRAVQTVASPSGVRQQPLLSRGRRRRDVEWH